MLKSTCAETNKKKSLIDEAKKKSEKLNNKRSQLALNVARNEPSAADVNMQQFVFCCKFKSHDGSSDGARKEKQKPEHDCDSQMLPLLSFSFLFFFLVALFKHDITSLERNFENYFLILV